MKVNPGLTNFVREIRRLCEADEEKDPVDLFHRRTDRRGIYAEKTLNPVFKGLLGIKNKGIKPLGLTPLFFMRKMGLKPTRADLCCVAEFIPVFIPANDESYIIPAAGYRLSGRGSRR